jgi:antitoxin PrlF
MAKSTLTSKGQITISKEVRDRLGLKVGDQLVFRFDERGKLTVEPEGQPPLGRLRGLLHHLSGELPATIEEMKQAVRARARSKPPPRLPRFEVKPKACGFRSGVDALRLNQLYDELEMEEFQRRTEALRGER